MQSGRDRALRAADARRAPAGSTAQPRWSTVLRSLREAAGATQEGWAAQLGFGRSTLQRWESGESPPGPEAETALLNALAERGLFRTFYQGPLRGVTVTAELIRDLLADARSAALRQPSRTPGSASTTPRTSFVGRTRELTDLQRALMGNRLVTLTGPGGAGKTRLALQVSARVAPQFADGVLFVDLSPLDDAQHVPLALLSSLAVPEAGQGSSLDRLVHVLGSRHALLVLDNCEHVLPACARIVDGLLAGCARLHVLCTSRQSLELPDELSWQLEGLTSADAVELFVQRAMAVRADFALRPDNSTAINRICEDLDGLPLAIELAAARARILTPGQLADKLDDRLRLLTTGNATAAPRHQTLRAALDWSYDLLTPTEQALLRRLGVFAGGWSLEAAERIGAAAVNDSVLDVLDALVTRSLVVADLRGERARYRLLETVRQYALQRLESAGEADSTRNEHLEWFAALAESAEPHLRGVDQARWLDRLEHELDNFRVALAWALKASEDESLAAGLRLAAALRWYWLTRGGPGEARAWLARALERADSVDPGVRGRALDTAAALAHRQGAYAESGQLQATALRLWREVGDERRQAAALSTLGIVAKAQGDHDRAAELLQAAVVQANHVGDAAIEATALNNLAALANDVGDYERGRDYLQQSLAIKRALRDAAGIATSLFNLGDAAVHSGELDSAHAYLSESLALFRRLAATNRIAQTLHSLGSVALRRDNLTTAAQQFSEARALFHQAADGWGQALCIEGLAEVAAARGDHASTARFFGAADSWRNSHGAPVPPNDRPAYERALAVASEALGAAAFAVAWEEGQALALDV